MDEAILKKSLVELIRRASCDLPPGVTRAIRRAARGERKGSTAENILRTICDNIALARDKSQPICQDTGTLIFYVRMPAGCDTRVFRRIADRAVARATGLGWLRQNSVDPLSGAVSKNNLAPGTPVYHFQPWGRKTIEVRLILKGGGCENVGTQYSLPDDSLG
ncbi:MAG: fumarate hydratase, partial [Phycisphaerae bacterium]|nr:fumarate hydratase [Phycisphaerae bacterium]